MENNNLLVEPGAQVQVPELRESDVRDCVLRVYGIRGTGWKRLDGYDDRNYHVTGLSLSGANGNLPSEATLAHGLVLKITNPVEAGVHGLIDAQTSYCLHVRKSGIRSPQLLQRCDGAYWAYEEFAYTQDGEEKRLKLPVRLMIFQRGNVVRAHMTNPSLLHDIGALVADFRFAAKDFNHPVYTKYRTHWALDLAPAARPFAQFLPHQWQKDLAFAVLDDFTERLPFINTLPRGQIHGDINEGNLLAEERDGAWRVCGVLDLWDTHRAPYIFDVALPIAYMMLLHGDVPALDVGAHVIAGYLSKAVAVSEEEWSVLHIAMCARIVQSVVWGYYTYHQNPVPENQYSLNTQAMGWEVLKLLWETKPTALYDHWKTVRSSH